MSLLIAAFKHASTFARHLCLQASLLGYQAFCLCGLSVRWTDSMQRGQFRLTGVLALQKLQLHSSWGSSIH